MWVAVGEITGKIYAKGKFKIDVLRELNKKYPYKRGEYRNRKLTNDPVYPEPLLLTSSDRSLPSSRNMKGDSPMIRREMNVGW